MLIKPCHCHWFTLTEHPPLVDDQRTDHRAYKSIQHSCGLDWHRRHEAFHVWSLTQSRLYNRTIPKLNHSSTLELTSSPFRCLQTNVVFSIVHHVILQPTSFVLEESLWAWPYLNLLLLARYPLQLPHRRSGLWWRPRNQKRNTCDVHGRGRVCYKQSESPFCPIGEC